VLRHSEAWHLYLSDGETSLLLIANDVIFVSRQTGGRVRERIARRIGIPAANMMITATHTHSGPMTVDMLSCEADPAVPETDLEYVRQLEDGMVEAALKAHENARPARIGLAVADGSCVGTNRHDPAGPSDPDVPVLIIRDVDDQSFVAVMVVCSMHPTVLHEDSTLVSGDFPAMARRYLQQHILGNDCPVVYHTGPCANQSPRHVTQANSFDEATRLGHELGRSIAGAVDTIDRESLADESVAGVQPLGCEDKLKLGLQPDKPNAAWYTDDVSLGCVRRFVDLPRRVLPSIVEAQEQLNQAAKRLEMLRQSGADHSEVRTAECDWFGAEETLTLARAAVTGRLEAAIASVMPAEIMVMRVGPWSFVGWPGEISVEFALEVKARQPDCHVISLANGELQGYVVTEQAIRDGRYEALNALFAGPESGRLLVEKTLELLSGGGTP